MEMKNKYTRLPYLSSVYQVEKEKLGESHSTLDVALFLIKLGQEHMFPFTSFMHQVFGPEVNPRCKTDIELIERRLRQIVDTHEETVVDEMVEPKREWTKPLPFYRAWGYVTDLLRLELVVIMPQDVLGLIKRMLQFPLMISILQLRPSFTGYLQDMVVTFMWDERICAELHIKLATG